jgi:urease accessory protein
MRDVDAACHRRCAQEDPHPNARRLDLTFARAGGRTYLARQFASYPWHVTRPFYLDREPAGLATLYLQSAAGGIYAGDHLQLAIGAAPGAQCQITTQGSTIVHDGRGQTSRLSARIRAGEGAFVGLTNEPTILFPGAAIETRTDVELASGATLILTDALVLHAPGGGRRGTFALFDSQLTVTAASGRVLLIDRARITGDEFSHIAPHGPFTTAGSVLALGCVPAGISLSDLEDGIAADGSCAAATRLPNDAGLMIRLLASDGVRLTQALRRAWEMLFTDLLGSPPGHRPK